MYLAGNAVEDELLCTSICGGKPFRHSWIDASTSLRKMCLTKNVLERGLQEDTTSSFIFAPQMGHAAKPSYGDASQCCYCE